MQTIQLNNHVSNFYIIYDGIKLNGISYVSEISLQSSYDLITMDNRDGFILNDRNSIKEVKQNIVFYVDDLSKIRGVFKFNKLTAIYPNNTIYFYKGFVENINYKPFKSNYYEVTVSLVLNPYILKKASDITLTRNGIVENQGDFETFPVIKIYPSSKEFSISINKKIMKFLVENELDTYYIVDMDNIEISNNSGELRNSIFQKDSDFLKFDVGTNSIVLNNISRIEISYYWRYIFYDLFKKQ